MLKVRVYDSTKFSSLKEALKAGEYIYREEWEFNPKLAGYLEGLENASLLVYDNPLKLIYEVEEC